MSGEERADVPQASQESPSAGPDPSMPHTLEGRFLDPSLVEFSASAPGRLSAKVHGIGAFPRVSLHRCFPMTAESSWISVRDREDPDEREIGILRDIAELRDDQRRIIEEALRLRYIVPRIHRVTAMNREYGAVYVTVETDKGPRSFVLKNLNMNVFEISPGRYLLTDVDECRYEIPDIAALDAKSLAQLRQHIYI